MGLCKQLRLSVMPAFRLVLNTRAGSYHSGWSENLEAELLELFARHDHELVIARPGPGDIESSIDEAVQAGDEGIMVAGGDGTVSAAAKHLLGRKTPLGILPLGTLNLAARDFRIPLDTLEAARLALASPPVPADVLEVNDRCCLCATILGFYPWLARRAGEYHGSFWWIKSVVAAARSVWGFSRFRPLCLNFVFRGEGTRVRTRLAAFVPGSYEEVFGVIPRRTDWAAGHLTAYISGHSNPWQFIRAGFAYLRGRWKDEQHLTTLEADQLTIDHPRRRALTAMLDGEIVELSLPVEIRLRHAALNIFAGPGPSNS